MTYSSPPLRVVGANIKGWPAMPAWKVRADLQVLRERSDVMLLQEFHWPWYWREARRVLTTKGWQSSPRPRRGIGHPVAAGQPVAWREDVFHQHRVRTWLLHESKAHVRESRWIRAVLLALDETGQRCWWLSTHATKGGDMDHDPPLRRHMLAHDLTHIDDALRTLRATGLPIVGEADLNVDDDSDAYGKVLALMDRNEAKVHGTHGVEWLWTIDGEDTDVRVGRTGQVPTSRLHTDHEARTAVLRLVTAGNRPADNTGGSP